MVRCGGVLIGMSAAPLLGGGRRFDPAPTIPTARVTRRSVINESLVRGRWLASLADVAAICESSVDGLENGTALPFLHRSSDGLQLG
jgi:hypothetical protein